MFKVYNCIAYDHDLRLVGLAAVICILASFAAINLLHHARKSRGHMWGVWLVVSAICRLLSRPRPSRSGGGPLKGT